MEALRSHLEYPANDKFVAPLTLYFDATVRI